jgi:hypothetical protein
MKIDGACHCGAIRYEAEIDPGGVRLCHCTDCQRLSGSAYRVAVSAAEGTFKLLSGEPKIYVKTGESGAKRAQAFCETCGSAIYATSVGEGPKKYGLRVGTIRQRAELRPARQFWCRSALDWSSDLRDIKKFERE